MILLYEGFTAMHRIEMEGKRLEGRFKYKLNDDIPSRYMLSDFYRNF